MSFPKYPKYKDSGVDWLGEVPSHWDIQKLKKIASFSGGGTPSRDNPAFWNGNIPWVSPKDMKSEEITTTEECITPLGLQSSATNVVPPGTIILVVRSGILRHTIPIAITKNEVALNQDMKAIHLDPGSCSGKFFLRWVQGLNDHLLLSWGKQGATVESIEHEYLSNSILPLPLVEEQATIATFLDRETAKIDALVAEQEKLIELLKEKRQAVISHAVTKGLDPNVPMKGSGVEWLGEVPEHWQVVQLKRILDEPMMYGANEAADDDTPNHPRFVRITDITENGDLREDTFRSLPPSTASPYILQDGDILLARSGATVGKSFIYKDSWGTCCFAGYLIRARAKHEIMNHDFLYKCFQSDFYWKYIGSEQIQATIQNVSAQKYGSFVIPIPPINEQSDIVRLLAEEERKVQELMQEAQHTIDLLKERRSALISAAVTGKIDVRGLAEAKQ